ncbi:MAG TPA: hypothetical protein DIU07_04000 [Rhodobacteraceae bacterium]|nr:hypothetical protein [Paracoccaceae bacterium]
MRLPLLTLVPLILAACAETGGGAATATGGRDVTNLPEGVLAIVAPDQDLTSVRIDEAGCYVYRYSGPVETTFLPLRSTSGRPICTRAQTT